MIPDDDDDDERIIDSSVLAAESLSITDDGDTLPTEIHYLLRLLRVHHLLGLLRVHHLLGLLRVHQLLNQLLRRHQLQIKCHLGYSPQRLGIQARNIDHLADMMIIFECSM